MMSKSMTQMSSIDQKQERNQPESDKKELVCLFACLIEDRKGRRYIDEYIVFFFPKQHKVRSIPLESQKGQTSGQSEILFEWALTQSLRVPKGEGRMFHGLSLWGAHS